MLRNRQDLSFEIVCDSVRYSFSVFTALLEFVASLGFVFIMVNLCSVIRFRKMKRGILVTSISTLLIYWLLVHSPISRDKSKDIYSDQLKSHGGQFLPAKFSCNAGILECQHWEMNWKNIMFKGQTEERPKYPFIQ